VVSQGRGSCGLCTKGVENVGYCSARYGATDSGPPKQVSLKPYIMRLWIVHYAIEVGVFRVDLTLVVEWRESGRGSKVSDVLC
jgi:hypothetical protein